MYMYNLIRSKILSAAERLRCLQLHLPRASESALTGYPFFYHMARPRGSLPFPSTERKTAHGTIVIAMCVRIIAASTTPLLIFYPQIAAP